MFVIPEVYVFTRGYEYFTDLYYSNLENNWNEDGDSVFTEPAYWGDTVDYDAEVYVGRIPCSTSAEASNVLNRIVSYQRDTSIIDYQTQSLFTGTNVWKKIDEIDTVLSEYSVVWDGLDLLTKMVPYLLESFSHRIYYEQTKEKASQPRRGFQERTVRFNDVPFILICKRANAYICRS